MFVSIFKLLLNECVRLRKQNVVRTRKTKIIKHCTSTNAGGLFGRTWCTHVKETSGPKTSAGRHDRSLFCNLSCSKLDWSEKKPEGIETIPADDAWK